MDRDVRCDLCRCAATHVVNRNSVGPDVPLCDDHYRYVEDEVSRDRQRSTSDRVLGYGRSSGLPGDHSLTCDKCSATWTGHAGELCPWCHANYAGQLRYQRQLLLVSRLDMEPDDRDYRRAVEAHTDRLVRAVSSNLITPDEGRRVVRRLLAQAVEVSS